MTFWRASTLIVLGFVILPFQTSAEVVTQSGFSYLSSTPEIHYQVTVNKKTIVSAALVVVDIGDAAPSGHEVASAELISQINIPSTFTFSKPNEGWPEGYYKIVVKDDDRIIETVKFNVISPADAATQSEAYSGQRSIDTPAPTPLARNAAPSGVLAFGEGGQLTSDAASAYVDALVFILGQIGQARTFNPEERQMIMNNLSESYATYPTDTQQDLASARSILFEYQNSWNYIGLDEQKEFAYAVLAIAYGEQAAADALGMNSRQGSGGSSNQAGSGGSSYYSDGASYVSDGECAIFSSEYGSVSSCD